MARRVRRAGLVLSLGVWIRVCTWGDRTGVVVYDVCGHVWVSVEVELGDKNGDLLYCKKLEFNKVCEHIVLGRYVSFLSLYVSPLG